MKIFTLISSIVLCCIFMAILQTLGTVYFDTYFMLFLGIALFGWILSGIPKIKFGFLLITTLFFFFFSFWESQNLDYKKSWGFLENKTVVQYHQRMHMPRSSSTSSSSDSSYSGGSSYSSGSSYGGRSYSGGGFSGGK